jgi:hypothetical protein
MSILDHEDLNEAVIAYLQANDLGNIADSVTKEIKSIDAFIQSSISRRNTNPSLKG